MSERDPEEEAILERTKNVEIETAVLYDVKKVAIIDTIISEQELQKIPYNIIIVNQDVILHFIKIAQKMPHKASQIVGAYCTTELEKELALLVQPKIKIGMSSEFATYVNFMKSIYPTATVWKSSFQSPKLHIILQIWKMENTQRLEELQVALYKNAVNPYIHKIHISAENDDLIMLAKIPDEYMHKITYFKINGRLTFKNAMEYITTLPVGDFAAIINTDIYFDETIKILWNICIDKTCIALLRYESNIPYALGHLNAKTPHIMGPTNCSQDAWIFKVKDIYDDLQQTESYDEYDICLGQLGCDNTILTELRKRHWSIANPSYSIHIYHLHDSNFREYKPRDRISNGIYTFIEPTVIVPLNLNNLLLSLL